MNMPSEKLEALTNKLSQQQRAALERFKAYICSSNGDKDLYLSTSRLYEILSPPSIESLAILLSDLVAAGLLEKKIRIESPETSAGIEDFSSFSDIPDSIHDFSSDRVITINSENIKILYRLDSKTKNEAFCNH